MANFRTVFDRQRIFSEPGSRIIDTFKVVYSKLGVKDLEKSGTIDIYDEIQSHADSVNIHKILERFNNGDICALSRSNPLGYFDASDLPTSFAEWFQFMADNEAHFNALPVDCRALFNHSFSEYLSQISTSEGLSKLNNYFNPVQSSAEPVSDVKEAPVNES